MPKAIEIEPNKTYVIEVDNFTTRDQMQHMMDLWKEKTGSNCLILQGAKLAKEFTDAEEAVQRVRELHKLRIEVNENGFSNDTCNGCYDEDSSTGEQFHHDYPCPTIEALDGEQ
jgi:hypothetical protein